MHNLLMISLFTVRDQTRHKSFFILLGVSILFVLLIRGCYEGTYTVNGQQVDGVTLAWHASKIAFHAIATGMFLFTVMLSMSIFSRDTGDGSVVLFLSRAVDRWQYVLGRALGTWLLSSLFMLILHGTIFLLAWFKTGGIIPGYLTASCVCSLNLLFTIFLVCLLSLILPDFIAAFAAVGILAIGFVSDGIYLVMQNTMVQSAIRQPSGAEPALWRIIYPKTALLQQYAVSLIDKSDFAGMGPLHPAVNVLLYTLVLAALGIAIFNKREI